MAGFSHLSSGVIIGLSISNPWLAAPVAFVSHFLLDSTPHYGEDKRYAPISQKRWLSVIAVDMVMTLALLWLLALNVGPEALLVGLVAMSPDIPFIIEELKQRFFGVIKDPSKRSEFTAFHSRIQRLERPWGWTFELVYAAIFATILFNLL